MTYSQRNFVYKILGILVYIKQDLKAVEVNIDQVFKECVLVKVNLRNRDKLLVGCIYKSPSSSDENHDKLNELLLYISKLEDSYIHILLAGDYNFPDIDWNSWTSKEKTSLNFLECIRDCFFQQVVEILQGIVLTKSRLYWTLSL